MLSVFLFLGTAFAIEDDMQFSLEGYYRTRGYAFHNLYASQDEVGRFMTQRLRLQPQVNYQNKAKFFMMADVIDDVVWGDNASLATTSLFAGDPSNNQINGMNASSIQIKRAWMDVDLGLGRLRVGRQESHWGMGLLANDGNGFDDAFGENHAGATFDRILFATRPLAVSRGLFGVGNADIPFYMGYAFDRLVEDPMHQYYGYICEKGIAPEDPDFNPQCYNADYDILGNGLSNIEHGYTSTDRSDVNRTQDWAMDNQDDVTEHVALAIYKGEDVSWLDNSGDFTAGVYVINRQQAETESQVWIWDTYVKFLHKGIYAEGELLNISGSTRAIVLPGASGDDPLYKDVDIWGGSGRLGTVQEKMTAYLEGGFAGGDDSVIDATFTGRPLHPDFNVGLLLYDQILATATSQTWTDSAAALWSQGGVYNSRYIYPVVKFQPNDVFEIVGAFVQVWPDKPDGAIIQCTQADLDNPDISCGSVATDKAHATKNHIGWESDVAIKMRLYNHFLFSTEVGYAQVTDRLNLAHVGLNPDGQFLTVQTRMAYEF